LDYLDWWSKYFTSITGEKDSTSKRNSSSDDENNSKNDDDRSNYSMSNEDGDESKLKKWRRNSIGKIFKKSILFSIMNLSLF
jgi:hypothetical protein